jgi:hypothetical protein
LTALETMQRNRASDGATCKPFFFRSGSHDACSCALASPALQGENRILSDGYGQNRRIELRFCFFPRGRGPWPSADLRAPPRISISRDPGETLMRPETERNIADIQQAIALLRRHL